MNDVFRRNPFSFLALAMGLMLSPDSLVVLGNSVGVLGTFFFCIFGAFAAIHMVSASGFSIVFNMFQGEAGEARQLSNSLGGLLATTLPLCSRVVFGICAATLILATAGYVFNEIFMRWVPNLGFSFGLLGLLLGLNLAGSRFSDAAQVFFVTAALAGITLMVVIGLATLGDNAPGTAPVNLTRWETFRHAMLTLTVFVGYDLAGFAHREYRYSISRKALMILALLVVATLYGLWGLVSHLFVPAGRLAESTVPYETAARAVFGDTGRVITGAVVLMGCCASLNVLFRSVPRMVVEMAEQKLLPSILIAAPRKEWVSIVLLSLAVAAMMAAGMAGDPRTEVYARSGLYFWLLSYAAVSLSLLITQRRSAKESKLGSMPISLIGLIGFCVGVVGLVWTDPERTELLTFMCGTAGVAVFFRVIRRLLTREPVS